MRTGVGPRLAAYAVVLVAVLRLVYATWGYELLGMDTYPVIASGLVRNFHDVFTIFTSPAVPGRVPYLFHGFYRPVITLSLGLDELLYGLDARGYFVTQALLFGSCAVALYEVARRVMGAHATVGPFATVVIFLLAPSNIETLAVVARRGEMLCGLFSLLAIATHAENRARRSFLLALISAIFTLLAMISKTTAIALVPAVFILSLTSAPLVGIVARLRTAIVATLPHLVTVAAAMAIEVAILGHVGGHMTSRVSGGFDRLPATLAGLFRWLALPNAGGSAAATAGLLLLALLVAVAAMALRTSSGRRDASRVLLPLLPAIAAGTVWLLGLASLYGAVGMLQGWYVFVPALAYALIAGAVAEAATDAIGVPALRAAGMATLACGVAWVAWQGSDSLLLRPYPQIDRASELTRRYLDDLRGRIDAAPPGTTLTVPPPPRPPLPDPDDPVLDGPLFLQEYALQSWADTAFPGRRIHFEPRRDRRDAQTPPDTLTIYFAR